MDLVFLQFEVKENKFRNMKQSWAICPECKSEHVLFDEIRGETFCTKCGLVLYSNARKSSVMNSQKKIS